MLGEEIAKAETLKTELKLEPIRADSVSLLQAGNLLLHLEFQVDIDEDPPLAMRMADYWLQLYRKYRLPVRQCVILLRKSAAARRFVGRFQQDQMLLTFDVIRVWELGKEVFLAHEELYPLAVLAATDNPERLLSEVAARVDTIEVASRRRSMAATAYILAGLRFSEEQLDVFFKEEVMKESVTYQKILKKGLAEGLEKGLLEGRMEGRMEGRAEGRAEGEVLGEAHALLKLLTIRGFAVSKKLRQRVLACQDLELLDRWLAQAVTAVALREIFPE